MDRRFDESSELRDDLRDLWWTSIARRVSVDSASDRVGDTVKLQISFHSISKNKIFKQSTFYRPVEFSVELVLMLPLVAFGLVCRQFVDVCCVSFVLLVLVSVLLFWLPGAVWFSRDCCWDVFCWLLLLSKVSELISPTKFPICCRCNERFAVSFGGFCVCGLIWLPLGVFVSPTVCVGVIESADNCRTQCGFLFRRRMYIV